MKNSEEDILKRFLQDTFSDYEPEPNGQTWENIRKEIQPQQPHVGTGFKQWILPAVALLLLIGGIVWSGNDEENNSELVTNSTQKNVNISSQIVDYQKIKAKKTSRYNPINIAKEYEKTYVNKTASKVESMIIQKVEQSLELPTFPIILAKSMAKQNLQEYSVSTKEFAGMDDKSTMIIRQNNAENNANIEKNIANDASENIPVVVSISTDNPTQNAVNNPVVVSISTDNLSQNAVNNSRENLNSDGNSTDIIYKSINSTNHNLINDAVIEEVRYVKPLETLKNKDFALIKNELRLPQINEVSINREAKPIRRPVYLSLSIMPLQTYRILTINSRNIQNLQTNNLFDSERNGWAFELGITKPIGNKWNLRSSISYLKMRQWADYQVNTENISVRNSNSYSNAVSVGNNDNEFIGQTRIESKTLQMVGLKVDVQRFFKISGRNRYFISGGSQLMVEPTQKQGNVFINASAGFQHLVNKDCFLTIEPTASYLLNNINDSKSPVQTNAYNLGLKIGLNFKLK